jgi:hypothetical protein
MVMARQRRLTAFVVIMAGVLSVGLTAQPGSAADGGTLYVIQGLPGRTVDIALDGDTVASDVPGATLTKALPVDAGQHTLSFSDGGRPLLQRSIDVKPGGSTDVVLHLPVDPAGAPVVTLFDNASTPVPSDKASLTVAHTAAVPPADIRVNGKVLFANIANGEALNLVVPVDTYTVEIVPAGAASPVVLGPLELTVKGASLNRVFAVGDPNSSTMRVVVHVLSHAPSGSVAPDLVDTGSGGQAAAPPTSPLPKLSLTR